MFLRHQLFLALTVVACSRWPALQASDHDRLAIQAFVYGLDSLARGEDRVRPCVGLDTRRAGTDPPAQMMAELRKHNSQVLTISECRTMFQNIDVVHDTIFIAVDFDSIATSPPRIGVRTWRSGLSGGGHLCSLQRGKDGWRLGDCQMVWIS